MGELVLVRHLGSGKYSDVFSVRHGTRRLAMKISYYRDGTLSDVARRAMKGDLDGAAAAKQRDAVCVSSAFSRFTTGIRGSVSPHFVAVHVSRDCDGLAERLRPLLTARLKTLTEAQQRHNNVSFMERFDVNLTRWLLEASFSDEQLGGVLFQIVYTLAALQKLLPGFRHNDLSTNNVLLRHVAPWTATYSYEGVRFTVAQTPVFVALADYDFTHVPGHKSLSNERILGGKYPHMSASSNPSYDAHLFLKSVQRCLAKRGPGTAPRTEKFLASLGMHAADRLDAPVHRLAPAAVLAHSYFERLKAPPPRRVTPDAVYRC